jgi:hypothetical protein
MQCEHHDCRCARANELASMGYTPAAIVVHQQKVTCRRTEQGERPMKTCKGCGDQHSITVGDFCSPECELDVTKKELAEALADYAACAHAIGIEHVQDMGPSAPGPRADVVAAIERARIAEGEVADFRALVRKAQRLEGEWWTLACGEGVETRSTEDAARVKRKVDLMLSRFYDRGRRHGLSEAADLANDVAGDDGWHDERTPAGMAELLRRLTAAARTPVPRTGALPGTLVEATPTEADEHRFREWLTEYGLLDTLDTFPGALKAGAAMLAATRVNVVDEVRSARELLSLEQRHAGKR